jgi:ABC-type bacteriocin/lantibiotic exporter with double-glycine peptidase domain
MVLLSFYHPFLFILNVIISISVCLFFFGFSQKALETSITESKAKYSVAFWLQELARKSIQFKTKEGRYFAAQKTDELTLLYLVERKQHFRVLFRQIIAFLVVEILMSSILLGVGGWLVVRGGITLGQLVASELVMSAVVLGLSQFGEYLETYYDLAAALDKLGQLFELPIEDQRESVSVLASESVPLLRVKRLQCDLKSHLNFTLMQGERIAWVGGYEHTRSHLMKVFYGMHPQYTGLIELDKMDYRYQSLEQIRSKIAYVGHTDLIQGSILENIQFGNPNISFHAIQSILEELGIYEVFCGLPRGLQTRAQDLDLDLLSQVRRKIFLARAVLSRPQLLILDISYDLCQREEDVAFDAFFKKNNHPFAFMIHNHDRELVSFVDRVIPLEGEGC